MMPLLSSASFLLEAKSSIHRLNEVFACPKIWGKTATISLLYAAETARDPFPAYQQSIWDVASYSDRAAVSSKHS